jgi:hypothetical protein
MDRSDWWFCAIAALLAVLCASVITAIVTA